MEHDVRVKPVVCSEENSEINILRISWLKCLHSGINRNEDPLIETRSSPHQFKCVKIWSNVFKMTPTLTKMLSGMKIKHISGTLFYCGTYTVFIEWIVYDYEILSEEAHEAKCSQDCHLQQMLYITMSYSHIMWCYYRQYIALWGMVWLLINVFDHVSHYCQHIWSSTWVMRVSFNVEIKERLIHCAPSMLDNAFGT